MTHRKTHADFVKTLPISPAGRFEAFRKDHNSHVRTVEKAGPGPTARLPYLIGRPAIGQLITNTQLQEMDKRVVPLTTFHNALLYTARGRKSAASFVDKIHPNMSPEELADAVRSQLPETDADQLAAMSLSIGGFVVKGIHTFTTPGSELTSIQRVYADLGGVNLPIVSAEGQLFKQAAARPGTSPASITQPPLAMTMGVGSFPITTSPERREATISLIEEQLVGQRVTVGPVALLG